MSLINDALKKAQAELKQQQSASSNFSKTKKGTPSTKSMSGPAKVMLLVGSLLVGSAMVLLVGLLMNPDEIMNFIYPEQKKSHTEKKLNLAQIPQAPIYTQDDFENDEDVKPLEEPAFARESTGTTEKEGVFTNLQDITESILAQAPAGSIEQENNLKIALNTNESRTKISRKTTNDTGPTDPIMKAVNKLTVTGVMFSGEESKVIVNSRVYPINAIIHEDPQLTLKQINSHEIVLADSTGTEYRKQL